MRTLIIFSILCLSLFYPSLGQNNISGDINNNKYIKASKQKKLGKSEWVCVYQYDEVDPILKKMRKHQKILHTNGELSVYRTYGSYQVDSVIKQSGIGYDRVTIAFYTELTSKYKTTPNSYLVKDYDKRDLLYNERIFADRYQYNEPLPEFHWTICKDTILLHGHICRKATTSFRGRDWVVWYAEDIPVSEGPWKFGGLPGLILKAQSTDREHKFVALMVERRDEEMYYDINSHSFKTTRKRFNREKKNYCTNTTLYISTAGYGDESMAAYGKRRMFYSPIEKE